MVVIYFLIKIVVNHIIVVCIRIDQVVRKEEDKQVCPSINGGVKQV